MFFGEYNHLLDEKARLRIPAKLKPLLGANFVITKGTNSCLFIFTKKYFEEEFLSKLNNVPTFDVQGQKPVRMLLSSTTTVEEDSQGRFVLPSNLKDFAKITKNVVFVGVGNRIELWSEENWNDYKGSDQDFDSLTTLLGEYDI